jgi:hypothetical protein
LGITSDEQYLHFGNWANIHFSFNVDLQTIVKKIRILEELPKSSIKVVLIGLVEFKGTAETKNEILQKTSPL